jgi:hypothetical protein
MMLDEIDTDDWPWWGTFVYIFIIGFLVLLDDRVIGTLVAIAIGGLAIDHYGLMGVVSGVVKWTGIIIAVTVAIVAVIFVIGVVGLLVMRFTDIRHSWDKQIDEFEP